MIDQKKELGLEGWHLIVANLEMGHEDEILRMHTWGLVVGFGKGREGGCVGELQSNLESDQILKF